MEMIWALDYAFTYKGKELPALRDVRFTITDGEVILIAGDSGSGKSTFLKSLNGLIPEITEGKMDGSRFLKGEEMEKLPIYEISRGVGSVFQNPRSQFFTLHVTSELVFAMSFASRDGRPCGRAESGVAHRTPAGPGNRTALQRGTAASCAGLGHDAAP